MGLIASFKVEEETGCKLWKLYSTIGAYDATSNPGGWGTPNPDNNVSMTTTLYILPDGYTKGWLFTITMGSGMISGFTITDPQGNVVDWFDWLTNSGESGGATSFLYLEQYPFFITNEMFGLPATTNIFQGHVYIEENIIIDDGATYTASEDQLMVCELCCCIASASAALEPTDCECQNDKIEKLTRATIFMDSAIEAMEAEDVDKSQDLYQKAKDLCEGKCNC